MDAQAKLHREHISKQQGYQYSKLHLGEFWMTSVNNIPITQNIEAVIQNHLYKPVMAEHLVTNRLYHPEAPDLINWDAVEKASSNLTIA
mgnify:CR=1 FL=1